jgi:hypothetical protein
VGFVAYLRLCAAQGCLGLFGAEAEKALDSRPQATQGNNAQLPKLEDDGKKADFSQHFARYQATDGVGRHLIDTGAVVGVLLAFGKAQECWP